MDWYWYIFFFGWIAVRKSPRPSFNTKNHANKMIYSWERDFVCVGAHVRPSIDWTAHANTVNLMHMDGNFSIFIHYFWIKDVGMCMCVCYSTCTIDTTIKSIPMNHSNQLKRFFVVVIFEKAMVFVLPHGRLFHFTHCYRCIQIYPQTTLLMTLYRSHFARFIVHIDCHPFVSSIINKIINLPLKNKRKAKWCCWLYRRVDH